MKITLVKFDDVQHSYFINVLNKAHWDEGRGCKSCPHGAFNLIKDGDLKNKLCVVS